MNCGANGVGKIGIFHVFTVFDMNINYVIYVCYVCFGFVLALHSVILQILVIALMAKYVLQFYLK